MITETDNSPVKYYRKEEFLKITNHIDIVPQIIKSSPTEMAILDTWEKHFQGIKEPYCIKERIGFVSARGGYCNLLSLWKRKVI